MCCTCTAFGSPLVPEVKIITKVSSGPTSRCGVNSLRFGGERGPLRTGGVEHPDAGQVETVEQMAVCGVGDQDLTVDEGDVAGQAVAAAGVVDAAQDVAAECGGRHGRQHLRGVGQQHADVQGPVGIGDVDERGGLGTGLGDVLAPGPRPVAVLHRDGVLLGSFTKQLLECVRHGSPRSVALSEQIRRSVYHPWRGR